MRRLFFLITLVHGTPDAISVPDWEHLKSIMFLEALPRNILLNF